jgi:hypothetical protein
MADQTIRCKRIIESKTYNTETSTLLSSREYDDGTTEYLFKTRHGAYFIYVDLPNIPDERIVPQSPEEARKWVEENCSPEIYEAEFGEAPEAGDPEARFTMRMPETLRKRVAAIAERNKQSLNAWIVQCLERAASDAEAGLRTRGAVIKLTSKSKRRGTA